MSASILSPEKCLIRIKGTNAAGEEIQIIKGLDIPKAADMMMQRCTFVYIVETRMIYIYSQECGGFLPNAEQIIHKELYKAFRPYYTHDGKPVLNKYKVSEIVARIHAATAKSITVFQRSEPLFNVANGVLDLETGKLLPHSPDYMMLEQSPVIYDPEADCPKFESYLEDALDPQYHDTLAEIYGYTMWPRYDAQRAIILFGPPRTGKGTLLRILQELLGKDNYSSVSLHDLINHTFKRAELFGKRANISGDLPATPIKDPQIFQNLTGGDDVTVEFKFGRPFQMTNAAKLIFAANKLPRIYRDDDAFYARWIIIPVEHSFLGKEDPSIEAALKTPEELSGILNLAFESLQRLKANGWQFSTHIDGLKMYRRQSRPETSFLEEMCEASEDGYVLKTDLVTEYNKSAKENGFPPATSMNAFGRAIRDQMIIPVDGGYRPLANGKQREAWAGIRLKEIRSRKFAVNA